MSNTQAQEWFSQIPEEPKPARHRGLWVALGVVVVACVVMAGLIVRNVTRDAADPVMTTDADRVAAIDGAGIAVSSFIATVDRVLAGGGKDATPYPTVATGDALKSIEEAAKAYRVNRWHVVGTTGVDNVESVLARVVIPDDPRVLEMSACLDVRNTLSVQANGRPTASDRPSFFAASFVVSRTATNASWLVSSYELKEAATC